MDKNRILFADPQSDPHGSQRTSGNQAHAFYIANWRSLQIDRLSGTYSFGIIEIGYQRDFSCEKATRTTHEEYKSGQGQRCNEYGYSNP